MGELIDLRMVEVQKREGAMGLQSTIGGVLVGGSLILLGIFAFSKISNMIDTGNFTTEEQAAYDATKDNILDSFELGATYIVFTVILGLIGLFMVLTR